MLRNFQMPLVLNRYLCKNILVQLKLVSVSKVSFKS